MFDAPLFDRPRTWKYALPGVLVIVLLPVIGKMLASLDPETQYWAVIPIGLAGLLSLVFLVNLWKYMSEHATKIFSEHQAALSITPLVLLADAMKQMHPEAVKVLNRFGVRTNWEVRLNAETYERDWLLSGTNAHFGFVEHVLSRSGKALFPKRSFAEGSKKWDPDGVVDDREQYDDLERWMFARMIVTRSHGDYKPAEFLPPWTPDLVLEAMGLTGEQDLYRPAKEPRKDLGATQQVPVNNNGSNGQNGKKDVERPLTDEEWQAIQSEMVAYSSDGNSKGDSQ